MIAVRCRCDCGRWFEGHAALAQHQEAEGCAQPAADEGYQERAARMHKLHRRRIAGEPIDMAREAASFDMDEPRLAQTLAAWALSERRGEVRA